ncbi:GIY-YIG nuclease family protein [bacterium]|nr:GIY-YIG nuclease family protein [bacterium]
MHYVYILQSIDFPEQLYVGQTTDLDDRLQAHNSGRVVHTTKYKPWKIVTYLAFSNKSSALDFEKYLKSSSGRAFKYMRLL